MTNPTTQQARQAIETAKLTNRTHLALIPKSKKADWLEKSLAEQSPPSVLSVLFRVCYIEIPTGVILC